MKHPSIRVRITQVLLIVMGLFVTGFLTIAYDIFKFGNQEARVGKADAAIVLGAAAWGNKPSPVYRERINEALRLYKEGRVKKLIFTGGTREAGFPSEAEVARQFAVKNGIPAASILIETQSRTTVQNLIQASELMKAAGIRSVLLVSDPLHMRRVMAIAGDLGLVASPAPTESSRFQTWTTRGKFLWRETWLYIDHLLLGIQTNSEVPFIRTHIPD